MTEENASGATLWRSTIRYAAWVLGILSTLLAITNLNDGNAAKTIAGFATGTTCFAYLAADARVTMPALVRNALIALTWLACAVTVVAQIARVL